MGHAIRTPNVHEIREQLERLCRELDASLRLRAFLRYVVEEALEGRGDQLNQYRIALDVFGRGDDFDPAVDSTVRVEAGKLRRAMSEYYLGHGASDAVRIELPKGTYAPAFRVENDAPRSAGRRAGEAAAESDSPPRLFVAPFTVHADAADLRSLASSLTEEITIVLTGFPHLRVVRRAPAPDEPDGYLLTGTLRRGAAGLRLTARLEERATSTQQWADAIDIRDDGWSTERIAQLVALRVGDIDGAVHRMTRGSIGATQTTSGPFTAGLLFHHYMRNFEAAAHSAAHEELERVIARGSADAECHAMLADVLRGGYAHGFTHDVRVLPRALELACKAVALDPHSPTARLSLGYTRLSQGRIEAAAREANRALRSASATARGDAGLLLVLSGDVEGGCRAVREALSQIEHWPGFYHHAFFHEAYHRKDYERAAEEAESIAIAGLLWDPLDRAAAHAMAGHAEPARHALAQLLALRPDFAVDPMRYIRCFVPDHDDSRHLLEGLRKAGLGVPGAG